MSKHVQSLRCSLLIAVSLGLFPVGLEAEPRQVEYREIPGKFEQFQDDHGFLWQVNGEGAITSGETQYLPSGMRLVVQGKPFAPGKANLVDDTESGGVLDLTLSETREGLTIQRSLWFDIARGGVRILDTVENRGEKPVTLPVQQITAFQFPWQNLAGTGGRLLATGSPVRLHPRDQGVTVKFSAADGRQDTVILLRDAEKGAPPAITASSNLRELVITHSLTIPPGKKQSLLHWVIRRNIGQLRDIPQVVSGFFTRRQLINARIPGDLVASIRNFHPDAFPTPGGPPPFLSNLTCLNELTDKVGVHRRNQDILWFSPSNQLIGEMNGDASVLLDETEIPLSAIAAFQGGGGVGRKPRIFLRNGEVRVGEPELRKFALKVGNEWSVQQWDPASLNLLLLRLSPGDGEPPAKAAFYVELRSGAVRAVESLGQALPVLSPWGKVNLPADELAELQYVSRPWPQTRVTQRNGSSLGGILAPGELSFQALNGEPFTVDSRSIVRIWRPGSAPLDLDLFSSKWNDLEDVPRNLLAHSGFLLSGNNFLAGSFAGEVPLALIENHAVVEIDPTQISQLRRLENSSDPLFEIELGTGDVVKGRLRQSSITVGSSGRSWTIPVRHLIAYQSPKKE